MENTDNYLEVNRELWNAKVDAHTASAFYDMEGFLKGNTSLNTIELDLLGDVKGKSILHLQCHFGQDTLSLARMGANVTGVDLSDKAIDTAQSIATQLGLNATFICCDVYNLPQQINEQFDIVFTSYGTIVWLPDMDKWAGVVSHFLKPGGQFVFVEFHPIVWMFDDDFNSIAYNYFKDDAIIETTEGTYADRDAPLKNNSISWNHSLSEVVTSLQKKGLKLTDFKEYDYSPYNCFKGMEQIGERKFQLQKIGNKLPLVYSILAVK